MFGIVIYYHKVCFSLQHTLRSYFTIPANANDLVMIINYDNNQSFRVLATVITIVNYDRKTVIVQTTERLTKILNKI
jgi:hypothetical protein